MAFTLVGAPGENRGVSRGAPFVRDRHCWKREQDPFSWRIENRAHFGMSVQQEIRTSHAIPEEITEWFAHADRRDCIPPIVVREWFGRVLQNNYRLFYGIAYGYFRNPSHAEDVVQSAALKALQKLRQLRQPQTVVSWFASITRNMCLDVLRDKNNRILEPLDEVNDLSARESIDQVGIDRQRLLLAEINKLPENQASVVRLRFVDDCDISEIAERLGLRKNTVEVRLHRALAKLAKSPRLQALKEESL